MSKFGIEGVSISLTKGALMAAQLFLRVKSGGGGEGPAQWWQAPKHEGASEKGRLEGDLVTFC